MNTEIKTAPLVCKNLTAKLPDDFLGLISVETEPVLKAFYFKGERTLRETSDTLLYYKASTEFYARNLRIKNRPRNFCIVGNQIFFSPKGGNGWLVILLRRIYEYFYPEKFIIKYY